MDAVLHVLDRTCDETTLQVLGTLLSGRHVSSRQDDGGGRYVCSIDGPTVKRAEAFLPCEVLRAERRLPQMLGWSPAIAATAERVGAKLLHVWGVEAASLCARRLPELPVVMTVLDSTVVQCAAEWTPTFPVDATVMVGSEEIRSRLLAAGIVKERLVVVRGLIDQSAQLDQPDQPGIDAARLAEIRESVVGDASFVILLSDTPSVDGGQFDGVWAAAIVGQVHSGLRVVLPYDSPESRRVQRFAADIGMSDLLAVPGSGFTWTELMACADVFVVPSRKDISLAPVRLAMASGVSIVATAVPSVKEIVEDEETGLLCEPGIPRLLSARLLAAVDDAELRGRIAEAARRKAASLGTVASFVADHAIIYDNILTGRLPATGLMTAAQTV